MGELVADVMEKVGGEGVISVEESKTTETNIEIVEGLQFDPRLRIAILRY